MQSSNFKFCLPELQHGTARQCSAHWANLRGAFARARTAATHPREQDNCLSILHPYLCRWDALGRQILSCRVPLSRSTKSQPIENNSYDNKSLFPETNGCTNSSGLNKLKKLSSFERSRVLPNLLLEPIPCVTSAAPPPQRRKRRRWQALKILKPGWPPPPLLSIFSLGNMDSNWDSQAFDEPACLLEATFITAKHPTHSQPDVRSAPRPLQLGPGLGPGQLWGGRSREHIAVILPACGWTTLGPRSQTWQTHGQDWPKPLHARKQPSQNSNAMCVQHFL